MKRPMKKVLLILKKLKHELLLDAWTILLVPSEESKQDGDGTVLAEVATDANYHQARITLYKDFWKEESYESVLRHELVHCISSRLLKIAISLYEGKLVTPDAITDADEELVSHIEAILGRR